MKKGRNILSILFILSVIGTYIYQDYFQNDHNIKAVALENIPVYEEEPFIVINDNIPNFEASELTLTSFENYSDLDNLGRSQVAFANISEDMMPTKKRESIGMIKPTGWHTIKYDNVDGKYLYNRCHLIGYQLTGENANEKNLMTCTRQMNTEGMLPFENQVAEYIKQTKNHVLYRVTPIYEGKNLLANGVEIEAKSVEDEGASLQFHVFVYNAQKDIEIDYKTGDSKLMKNS